MPSPVRSLLLFACTLGTTFSTPISVPQSQSPHALSSPTQLLLLSKGGPDQSASLYTLPLPTNPGLASDQTGTPITIDGAFSATALSVDSVARKIYVAADGAVLEYNYDGSASQRKVSAQVAGGMDIVHEEEKAVVYFASDSAIRSANLDGSETEEVLLQAKVSTPATQYRLLAIDAAGGWIYYTQQTSGQTSIWRRSIKGGEDPRELYTTERTITDLKFADKYVYWTEYSRAADGVYTNYVVRMQYTNSGSTLQVVGYTTDAKEGHYFGKLVLVPQTREWYVVAGEWVGGVVAWKGSMDGGKVVMYNYSIGNMGGIGGLDVL
ncbi:hypothetical protein BCR34DRAFT_554168 [Clohesyomyces aquaticus]|uniref:DUF5050 domain-containing protein n=1 Tax=Clohesyomyces aquaticus TaxID=1231657 RepID=A0A1Y2A7A1_9PLEO|nr:hypothetical protein BCR34DRAFT_554168 [Clohesyomyces aquaticus]